MRVQWHFKRLACWQAKCWQHLPKVKKVLTEIKNTLEHETKQVALAKQTKNLNHKRSTVLVGVAVYMKTSKTTHSQIKFIFIALHQLCSRIYEIYSAKHECQKDEKGNT